MQRKILASAILSGLTLLPLSARAATAMVTFDWSALTVQSLSGVATFADSGKPVISALASDMSNVVKNDGNKAVTAEISTTTTSTVSLDSVRAIAVQGYAGGELAHTGSLRFSQRGVALIQVPYSYAISAMGKSSSATARIHFAGISVMDSPTPHGTYGSAFDRYWEVAPGMTESGKGVMELAFSSQGSDTLQIQVESSSAGWAFGDLTIPVAAVPEPTSAAMLLSGIAFTGVVLRRRRSRSHQARC